MNEAGRNVDLDGHEGDILAVGDLFLRIGWPKMFKGENGVYTVFRTDPPVVILIHGGGWQAEYDLRHISQMAAAVTQLGFATCGLEYRRIGNPGGGSYPWPA